MNGNGKKDLIVLVADKHMEFTLRGLLSRRQSFEIREIDFDISTHLERDPGCYKKSEFFLRSFIKQYSFSMVLFDRKGCGEENSDRTILENTVEGNLSRSGWENRCAAIALDPELEAWVWSDSPKVDDILGWKDRNPDLRSWLRRKYSLSEDNFKPPFPKEALKEAIRMVNKQHSSALFRDLAESVSFKNCHDPSFVKFKASLKKWFDANT
ncbi:MAG: hypothetical protein HZA02_04025 [Nitrospinae bacterium]|nr:hypothetical protein [Nitrospinota bacterium]